MIRLNLLPIKMGHAIFESNCSGAGNTNLTLKLFKDQYPPHPLTTECLPTRLYSIYLTVSRHICRLEDVPRQ